MSDANELTCPKCDGSMRSYERNGIQVEQCRECRGIFLDRGELERLMEAEAGFSERQAPAPPPAREYDDRQSHSGGYQKRKKSSFLSEIFD